MGLLTVKKEPTKGKLYILYMWVGEEEELMVKIGVTTKPEVVDRVLEIIRSYYFAYRVCPKVYPKRFKTVDNVYAKERQLHKYFEEYKYEFDKPFSGKTEFFKGIDEEELLDVYDRCIKGTLDEVQEEE
jgi:hypothetical protein